MTSLISFFVRNNGTVEDHGGLKLWKRSYIPRKTKVYAIDFVGGSLAASRKDETIKSRSVGFLKSA
jgi:hypothetical protein